MLFGHASKDGLLKPVVQIEPVHIRGADIEFATANNAKNVEENKIGIGAIVLMLRSGDVIPKIEKVVVPAENAQNAQCSMEMESIACGGLGA